MELQKQFPYDYYVSWPDIQDAYAQVFHRLEYLSSKAIGTYATRSLAELFLDPRRIERMRERQRMRERRRQESWRTPNTIVHCGRRLPKADGVEIYHSPFHALPPRQWTGRAVRIVTIADIVYHKHRDLYPAQDTPYITKVLESIDTRRDHVICMSESTRNDVLSALQMSDRQTHTIPVAHNPEFHHPQRRLCHPLLRRAMVMTGKYVLALGQPNPRKNAVNLAKAWQRLRQTGKFDDYGFIFIVSKNFRERFEIHLKRSGAPMDLFTLIEDVDDAMLASFYNNAAVFAYVSKYEGFGLPPLEAMAADCPVVVSCTSSLPEVVGEAGEYVDPENVDSIADGLRIVLTVPERRATLKRLGRARVKRYSWERTVEQTIELYERILAEPSER